MYRLLNWVTFVPVFASFALPTALLARPGFSDEKLNVINQKRFSVLYGKLPLSFEANEGQADSRVKYVARANGYSVLLGPNGAMLTSSGHRRAVHDNSPASAVKNAFGSLKDLAKRYTFENPKARTLLRIKPVGANPQPRLVALQELPGKSSYFIGNDPKKWRTRIPTYLRVKYEEIYPGIDLVFHGNQGQLEYDFIVAPGADPSVIQLSFSGAGKLSFDDHGNLIVRATMGDDVIQYAPILYQEVDGIRKNVNGRYVLKSAQQVGFQAANYDSSKPLIIDPVLSYSTYFGTEWDDFANRIAVDPEGNSYVSINIGLDSAAEILKLNPSGSALVYAVWLAGTAGAVCSQCAANVARGIAVDTSGNAYVAGWTSAIDFPTVNAFQQKLRGPNNIFVTKISSDGNTLVYSTYLGGSLGETPANIAIDDSGNTYVAGNTGSRDFPIANAFQSTFSSGNPSAGFITKINARGDALVYSTYLAGASRDIITGIAVDAAGQAYITGQTFSSDFPTVNALQSTYRGGGDAFVTKLNPVGSALVYSTYLGGSQTERATDIAVDAVGNAYVVGDTESSDFPVFNSLQPSFPGGNGFITKINPTGGHTSLFHLLWGEDFIIFFIIWDQGGGRLSFR